MNAGVEGEGADTTAMKILVLGDSDTSGRFSGGITWPELLEANLNRAGHGSVSVSKVGLSVVGGSAHTYAEKKVREFDPDVVVLALGTFGFTAKMTWLRVQQLFGKRAGAWYRSAEENFDRRTRDSTGTISPLNGLARKAIRRALPGKTFSTREEVTERYREVFRSLGRFEDKQILVMRYPNTTVYPKRSKMPAERRRFVADMKAAAEKHHYEWIETESAFASADADGLKSDSVHFNSDGHVLLAQAMEAAILGRGLTSG